MAIEVTIPRLGWSMDEGTFGEWLKEDGEYVEAGDALFTIESDKALQEVESVDSGWLHRLPDGPDDGDTVRVGASIGWLLETADETPPASTAVAADSAPNLPDAPSAPPAPTSPTPAAASARPVQATIPRRNSAPDLPAISPRAARVARDLGVDWTRLSGSGSSGRIRESDVRQALPGTDNPHLESLTAIQRQTADRMLDSAQATAAVTLTTRANAANLVSLREQFRTTVEAGESTAPIPAIHDIVIKLTALVLRRHSRLGGRWTDSGIVLPERMDIGLAVDTPAGLLVPVIRAADQHSLSELSAESRRLIEAARTRTLAVDQLSGGIFTVTNLGAYGIDAFTPIINAPQSAILGLGAIRREAIVGDDDQIEACHQMTLSLTFDHRVNDGAPAARFLQELTGAIENPAAWLID